jgi:hypothetical protein
MRATSKLWRLYFTTASEEGLCSPAESSAGRTGPHILVSFAPKETKWSIVDEKESSASLDHPENPALMENIRA